MNLARVIGTVVATVKYPGLEGQRMLIVQPLNDDLSDRGRPIVAIDAVQSGPGDVVQTAHSREAGLALEPSNVPVDAAIVGIVDQVYPTGDA